MATLIIEDGSNVANANSYVDLAFAREFAESRGLELPTDDNELSVQILRSMDFIESYRSQYQGSKTNCDQALQFPREDLCIDDCEVANNVIPLILKQAVVMGASFEFGGESLQVNSDGREVASERVEGAVSVSYFQNGQSSGQTFFKAIDSLISPLFRSGSGIVLGMRV